MNIGEIETIDRQCVVNVITFAETQGRVFSITIDEVRGVGLVHHSDVELAVRS